jgi:hypothetical protein
MLPYSPSAQAEVHELADFAELLCWEQGSSSAREIVAALGRLDDNDHNVGAEDNETRTTDYLDDVMNEINRRAASCNGAYPFSLGREGASLHYQCAMDANPKSIVYRYLLLSTRLNMKDDRMHDGLDGSLLLEELAAHVLRNYLGASRARSFVFGTAIGGNFQARIEGMCRELGEGGRFRNLDNLPPSARDDALDAVAWIPFADRHPGQLIVFAQCKTGSSWGDHLRDLQPDDFVMKWMERGILVKPMRAFCVAESADRRRWSTTCVDAGILLDRCRLVDFSDNVDANLLERIVRWANAARASVKVATPLVRKANRRRRKEVRHAGRTI